MRVSFIPNGVSSNNIRFKGSVSSVPQNHRPNNKPQPENKPLPEWARKSMLGLVIFFTVKNEPVVQDLFTSNNLSQEELDKIEYYQDVQNVRKDEGVSTAFYQLNKLDDIERPKIKKIGKDSYALVFNLDKTNVNLELTLNKNSKDIIQGRVKVGKGDWVNYKAVFPNENKDEFKILLEDKKVNKKMVFGRDFNGELYRVVGDKKVTINSKNVEKYEQYKENLEAYDDLRFFTDENPLWRNLNYLILIFLLYNEMKHDNMRRKNKQNLEDKNNKI